MKVGDLVTIIQSPSDKFVPSPYVGDVGVITNIQLGLNESADKFMVQTRNGLVVVGINWLRALNESR